MIRQSCQVEWWECSALSSLLFALPAAELSRENDDMRIYIDALLCVLLDTDPTALMRVAEIRAKTKEEEKRSTANAPMASLRK